MPDLDLLRTKIAELEIELEELNECGDLEDRLDAALRLDDWKKELDTLETINNARSNG